MKDEFWKIKYNLAKELEIKVFLVQQIVELLASFTFLFVLCIKWPGNNSGNENDAFLFL